MKTDILHITAESSNLESILAETEKASSYSQLDEKQSDRLRLLAEELVEMLPELLKFGSGDFWIESEGKKFELHTSLVPNEALTAEKREELLAVSTTGKNESARGIMAKIRLAAEFMLIDYEKTAAVTVPFYANGVDASSGIPSVMWSLESYREKSQAEKGEPWDELERSIIANLADDVLVGLSGRKVEIIVKKSF